MPKIGMLEVSAVGLGCNNFGMKMDQQETTRVVDAAIDAGITFFDTADIYGNCQSEVFLGRALGSRMADVVVATKFGVRLGESEGGARPQAVRAALEGSLRRLGAERIDMYLMHYPSSWMVGRGYPEPLVPIEETLGVLDELRAAGKIGTIGCSNFSAAQVVEADDVATTRGVARFECVQNGLSMLDRTAEADVLPECAARGIGFVPYFPLASGLLTGKYRRDRPHPDGSRMAVLPQGMWTGLFTDHNFSVVERLTVFAEDHGRTLLELAMSWLLTRPAVSSIIAGATTPDQVKINAGATSWVLSDDDLRQVDSILESAGQPA